MDVAVGIINVFGVVLEPVGDGDGDFARLVLGFVVVHIALVRPVRHLQGEVQVVVIGLGDADGVAVVMVDVKVGLAAVGVPLAEGYLIGHLAALGLVHPVASL